MRANWIDLTIVIVLVSSALIGYKTGFIYALTGIISNLAGLVIAFIFRNRTAKWLEECLGAVSALHGFIEKRIRSDIGEQAWVSLPIFKPGLDILHEKIGEFAFLIISAFCFLILYILSSQLIRMFGSLLTRVIHLGYLERVNQIGGAFLITFKNLIVIAFFGCLVSTVLTKSADLGIEGSIKAIGYVNQSLLFSGLLRLVASLTELVRQGA